ncbi:NAD(P)H azoreductase [Colletotrichum orbiculare MAFF 240422]|uniref:NAD(P)H azoreductase n=1 Tax=Colletotrichum orbiculare (strain 104-T / ATCC 96160 / CBS 514.97 / LARS 414 / MAFF 240422) TaxID=1213857 RepID=N4UY42_COLOR|nr:NAD(P)H azoreductase [Colletotrichum orbiculare MAFF 240422]
MTSFIKPIPKSILILGAAGHIGRPLAEFLVREAPTIKLRLATSNSAKFKDLQSAFPGAEVVRASYHDASSLLAAVNGIEGVFVITPPGMQEEKPMTDLVAALKSSNTATHIIRLTGIFPELAPHRVPSSLGRGSLPVEHPIAKRILDASGLPVTYINSGASFLDNLPLLMRPVAERKTLVWPEHRVPFIDPRDIAEVAGRLFLSPDARHVGAFHTMNNGHDRLRFADVAAIVSEVLGVPVAYDGSFGAFSEVYAPVMGARMVRAMWDFFKFEEANEETWALNDFVERTLGRRPQTVRGWLLEHEETLLAGGGSAGWVSSRGGAGARLV